MPLSQGTQEKVDAAKIGILKTLEKANKELWLLLSLFLIMAMMNFAVDSGRMVLGFYTFPTVFSAYSYGRRHAMLTAFASVLMVVLFTYYNPVGFEETAVAGEIIPRQWLDITVWGGTLIVIGYLMGSLYEHQERHLADLRETYHGVLMILFGTSSRRTSTPRITAIASQSTRRRSPRACSFTTSGSRTSGPPRCCTTSANWTSAGNCSTRQHA